LDWLARLWKGLGACAAVLVLALAQGCGGGDSDKKQASTPAASTPTTSTPSRHQPAHFGKKKAQLVKPSPTHSERVPQKARDLPVTAGRVKTAISRGVPGTYGRQGARGRPISVHCSAGRCVVRFVNPGAGLGALAQLEGPIWKELASNPRVREAIVIGGRTEGRHELKPGQHAVRFLRFRRCDRAALDRIRRIGLAGLSRCSTRQPK
jgi:hypothetical protein